MIEISPTSYSMTQLPSNISFGNYCSFGSDLKFIFGGTHLAELNHDCVYTTNYDQTNDIPPITIGHDVWIGDGVRLMNGIKIGNGAIIGAGAVIAKDVPPFAVVVGNPQVIKRMRFSLEQIKRLEEIRWWHWGKDTVLERLEDMKDINVFLEKYA